MKTSLIEIKNEYAREQGYEDWEDLQNNPWVNSYHMERAMNKICIRAQKAALENAAESATMTALDFMCDCGQSYNDWSIDRTSITNPENLIR